MGNGMGMGDTQESDLYLHVIHPSTKHRTVAPNEDSEYCRRTRLTSLFEILSGVV